MIVNKKHQQRLFVLGEPESQCPLLDSGHANQVATNTMLDLAFAISYFVCLVLLWIFGMNHLNAVWRITLGLGTVPPLLLLYFRLKMQEVNGFKLEQPGPSC